MSTAAQAAANQANAQLSTGPRTVEGKARVSQNAIRHGLTAKHLVVRAEEQEEFTSFQESLTAELDPQGALETTTFHELLHAAWTLARLRRIEAEVCRGGARDFIQSETTTILDRLGRYQARAQRAYYRAIKELRTLQTDRALRAAKLHPSLEAAVPSAAGIQELTKQTQSEAAAKTLNMAVKPIESETGAVRLESIRNLAPPAPPTACLNPS